MKYKEIKIYPKREELDALVEALNAAGRTDLVINDPGELEGIMRARDEHVWDYVDPEVIEDLQGNPYVCFYLQEGEDDPAAMDIAKGYAFTLTHVDDEDWLHKWEEYFMPTKISERFVVKPAWRQYEPKEGEDVITIDPGLAFGTGTHATTFLTLRLMEKYLQPGDDVLDVGSGSGILSIGAVKLGAARIWAVDLFDDAVQSTKKNAALNGCGEKIEAFQGDLTKGLDVKADLVCANLMADLVKMLSKDVAKHLKGRGLYISSGILDEKEEDVAGAIKGAGFDILDVIHADGWCAICAAWNRNFPPRT
ncbi:MAG: 50S ribosomal protein L11 methyltransferase [Firmicutes bacterium]|nr:50S ribosomal protein L11 methyltransferase [Bacillota bacterium]